MALIQDFKKKLISLLGTGFIFLIPSVLIIHMLELQKLFVTTVGSSATTVIFGLVITFAGVINKFLFLGSVKKDFVSSFIFASLYVILVLLTKSFTYMFGYLPEYNWFIIAGVSGIVLFTIGSYIGELVLNHIDRQPLF